MIYQHKQASPKLPRPIYKTHPPSAGAVNTKSEQQDSSTLCSGGGVVRSLAPQARAKTFRGLASPRSIYRLGKGIAQRGSSLYKGWRTISKKR
mmetsp:Transcript_35441/g.75546  ORF Transcript_35441/g.75546 Transcript_35441/m.75546 type:complete len:93 (-) Transcript_35441:159-437(-)